MCLHSVLNKPISRVSARTWQNAVRQFTRNSSQTLEPDFNGQHIAIHVDTEDYAVAPVFTLANRMMMTRRPVDGRLFGRRIGAKPDDDFVARMMAFEVLAGRSKMILGHVHSYFPRVTLTLPGVRGPLEVEFIVDTGFDGDLSVPTSLLAQLEVEYATDRHMQMVDGSIITSRAYLIYLDWNDDVRLTEVTVLEIHPCSAQS